MYTFGQICIGDLFNTKSARWVKTTEGHAICVMSSTVRLGAIHGFNSDAPIVLLWSVVLKSDAEKEIEGLDNKE